MASRDPGVLSMVLRLFNGLHASGVDCSVGEAIDAARALTHLDLLDRRLVRSGLRATLIKRSDDYDAFDVLFEQCFALTPPEGVAPSHIAEASRANAGGLSGPAPPEAAGDGHAPGVDALALAEMLAGGTDEDLRDFARNAVARLSGIAGGEMRGSERYFLQRVLRALDLARLLSEATRAARAEDDDPVSVLHRRAGMLDRIEHLKGMLAEEVRRQLFSSVGTTGVGLIAPRRIEDTELLGATHGELRAMREVIRPLARRLSHRLSQQHRRHRRGRLDIRRTMRRSLQMGGVPLEPAYRRRARTKPDVVVLCDISGSVAQFARFTLLLMRSLSSELRGLRSFVFVDGVAEITTLLAEASVDLDPRLLATLPGVVVDDGHSNYDAVLKRFLDRHADAVTSSTTVLVTGDGRTNYRDAGAAPFRDLCQRARRVYWFDPEPQELWATHDSAIPLYRACCDGVFEVRTLAQLAQAIAKVL